MQATSAKSLFLSIHGVKQITVIFGGEVDVVFDNGLSILYSSFEEAAKHVFDCHPVDLALELGRAAA